MSGLHERLAGLRTSGRKALVFFLTAGYPDRESCRRTIIGLAESGADVIEIGMPFSDPVADGPVIQESSEAALRNGVTLETVLEDVAILRKSISIPIVLMGYVNPILRYGPGRFFTDATAAGISGIILPEVPLEESDRFRAGMTAAGISQILLIAPTTSPERATVIDQMSDGFVYCVSTTGVTGHKGGDPLTFLRKIRPSISRNPMYVGFGIATPDDVRTVGSLADGVIVGSALIRQIVHGRDHASVMEWARELRAALDETE
jgi:tryptophan synthase alpha chain